MGLTGVEKIIVLNWQRSEIVVNSCLKTPGRKNDIKEDHVQVDSTGGEKIRETNEWR